MKLRRPSFESSVATLAALAITAASIWVQAWFVKNSRASIGYDEGHVAAFAERLITNHWMPYVDAVCHRGPLLYWYAAIMQRICGPYRWLGMRVGTLLAAALGVFGSFIAAWAGRRPFAGVVAGTVLVFMTCTTMDVSEGQSMQGEQIAVPLVMGALACVAAAILRVQSARGRLLLLFAGGLLASLSALAKQTAALIIIPLSIWVTAWSFADPAQSWKTGLRRLAVLLGGWALPSVLIVIWYAAKGELGTFYYWYYTFNAKVYMGPYRHTDRVDWVRDWIRDNSIVFLTAVFALGPSVLRPLFELDSLRPRGFLRAYERVGFEATCGLIGGLFFASVLATLRGWPHYWIIVIPWVGMTAGLHADNVVAAAPTIGRRIGYVTAGLLLIGLAWTGAVIRLRPIMEEKKHGSWAPARPDAICDTIESLTRPDEGMFVWGFDGDLYVSCRRHAVSRYVTLHVVAGIVPPFWTQPSMEWVARGARETLLSELVQARPPLILDIPAQLRGFSMTRVPELKTLLARDYCDLGDVSGRGGRTARFYLLKGRLGCPITR